MQEAGPLRRRLVCEDRPLRLRREPCKGGHRQRADDAAARKRGQDALRPLRGQQDSLQEPVHRHCVRLPQEARRGSDFERMRPQGPVPGMPGGGKAAPWQPHGQQPRRPSPRMGHRHAAQRTLFQTSQRKDCRHVPRPGPYELLGDRDTPDDPRMHLGRIAVTRVRKRRRRFLRYLPHDWSRRHSRGGGGA